MSPTHATVPALVARPPTGAEYLRSLDDGRCVYLDGQRVANVAAHEGLRNAARSVARLYDALHTAPPGDSLAIETDTGSGGRTHAFFRIARTREDMRAAQRAIEAWARMSYGWMGRTPDYKASLTVTLGARADFFGDFESVARRWYREAQETIPFLGHAIANPPVDKHLRPEEQSDVPVRIVRERDDGVIVSGAKVVATSAAIANQIFVGQTPGAASPDPAQAVSFIVPVAAEGVRLICRNSYEQAACRRGGPFDAPLSSRFDENDAILVLDEVFVPWESILIHRDPERTRRFFPESGFVNNFLFHGCTRLAVKLEFLAGLLAKALRATGAAQHRGTRALLGEAIGWAHTIRALSDAMASDPEPWSGGALRPQKRAAMASCLMAPQACARVREIIQQTVASGLIYLPAGARDLANPEVEPMLRRYVRGSNGMPADDRIKIMKLLWDAVGSEFGGRHDLYERSYAGGWECTRLMVAGEAEGTGRLAAMEDLVDACMADYDQRGWCDSAWTNTPVDA